MQPLDGADVINRHLPIPASARPREAGDVEQTDIPPPPLDVADIARMQARFLREPLLGEAPFDPEGPHGSAEGHEFVLGSIRGHLPTLRDGPRIPPCTMGGS